MLPSASSGAAQRALCEPAHVQYFFIDEDIRGWLVAEEKAEAAPTKASGKAAGGAGSGRAAAAAAAAPASSHKGAASGSAAAKRKEKEAAGGSQQQEVAARPSKKGKVAAVAGEVGRVGCSPRCLLAGWLRFVIALQRPPGACSGCSWAVVCLPSAAYLPPLARQPCAAAEDTEPMSKETVSWALEGGHLFVCALCMESLQ